MNKLMGFYELKYLGIPTVKWEEFKAGTKIPEGMLWTVRTALLRGNDYNLPRIVGVEYYKAQQEAEKIKEQIGDNGLVIYYPYFIAHKSGTVKISLNQVIVEAVHKDLWNLVSHGKRDVTVIIRGENTCFSGNREFLTPDELEEIMKYARLLQRKYRSDIGSGSELYLEWSYAYNSSLEGNPIDERYLLFYEMRII